MSEPLAEALVDGTGPQGTVTELPVQPSTPVLLFVPAIVPSENQTALRLAQLLAQSASKTRAGTYTIGSSPLSTRAIVRDPQGDQVLDVRQVDYRDAMYDATASPEDVSRTTPRDVVRALWFAVFGSYRLALALKAKTKYKSGRARVQIFIACLIVGALWLSFALMLAALVAAIASQSDQIPWLSWLPAWVPAWVSDQQVVVPGLLGAVVALYWWARDPVLTMARRLRAMMSYVEHQDVRLRLSALVDQAVDDVLDEDPNATIHLLGYSFGGIVLLDAIYPDLTRVVERRDLDAVVSLTTVGCPADFLRLLYPDHFLGERLARVATDLWTNVFIPADVLGSNFRSDDDDRTASAVPPVAAAEGDVPAAMPTPAVNVAVGRAQVTRRGLLTMDGFAVHGRYWAAGEPRHLENVLRTWLPTPADAPAVAQELAG